MGNIYTKTEIDVDLNLKADKSDTYTKTEVNNALALKADKTDTYTKTEMNNALALKADKSDTYTKAQVDSMVTGSTITNYVTTDTLQTITGTKIFGEAHATDLYATNFRLNTHNFTTSAFVSGDTSDENKTLCSQKYIENYIQNYVTNYINGTLVNQISFNLSTIKFCIGMCAMTVANAATSPLTTWALTFPCMFWKYGDVIYFNGEVVLQTTPSTGSALHINNFNFIAGSTTMNGEPFWSNGGSSNYDVGGLIKCYCYWDSVNSAGPQSHDMWILAQNRAFAWATGKSSDPLTNFTRDGRWKLCFNTYKVKYIP